MGHSNQKHPRGEILLTGPTVPVPTATAALTDISGPTLLREACDLTTIMMPPRAPTAIPPETTLTLGLLTTEQLSE